MYHRCATDSSSVLPLQCYRCAWHTCIHCENSREKMNIVCFYLSTNIPACTACTMLRNFGFSSERRTGRRTLWVKVDASQSVTSEGTPSDCSCWRSSSDSRHCLGEATKHTVRQCWVTDEKWIKWIYSTWEQASSQRETLFPERFL